MRRFDLAAFQLFFAIALERGDLPFGEHEIFFGGFFLKGGQVPLEGLQIMAQPYGANARWADEHALLARLDAEWALLLIEQHRISHAHMVPTMFVR